MTYELMFKTDENVRTLGLGKDYKKFQINCYKE